MQILGLGKAQQKVKKCQNTIIKAQFTGIYRYNYGSAISSPIIHALGKPEAKNA